MKLGPIQLRWSYLFCATGSALLLPLLMLGLLALDTPITTSGVCYTLGAVVSALGLVMAPWLRRTSWLLFAVGMITLVSTAGVRLRGGGVGTAVRLVTFPELNSTRWGNHLIHERDLSLFGQRIGALTGVALNRREADGLTEALTAAYASLDTVDSTTSSPCLSTYLLLQHPTAFDMVVVEPEHSTQPTAAIVYLHGFAGNFTVQAWLVAQAARELNMLTVAPSVGFVGNWWTPRGEATVKHTIAYLRSCGIQRIYLAGLSNGAVGTCRLAPKLRNDISGLILISGADAHAADSGLPVLALQGAHDDRMPAYEANQYINQAGTQGTYREFDGDHLLLAKRAKEVQAALKEWLVRQE